MEKNIREHILLSMAKIQGKQVDTEAVKKSLRLICETFHFQGGLVYEADYQNEYKLKEQWMEKEERFCESFSLDLFSTQYRKQMAKEAFVYVEQQGEDKDSSCLWLDMFRVKSIGFTTIADEKDCIYGFIIFINEKNKIEALEAQKEELSAVFSMISKYVGIRVYQNQMMFAQKSLENILDNTGIDIYVNDFYNHDILYVNQSMAEPYGGQTQFSGRKCYEVLFNGQQKPCEFCPQQKLIDHQGNPTKVYTWDYQRAFDGSWFRVFSAAFRWVDGRLAHVVSSANITDEKKSELLIEYLANYDELTGLPNRRKMILDCENKINKAKEGEQGYVLFFDIDGFKAINDKYGHDAGDEFLVKLGEFFKETLFLQDCIYRNGGDEFVAILEGNVTKEDVYELIANIHKRFSLVWQLKKGAVRCNISVGVSCYPEDGQNAEVLLNKADQAMYIVKKTGGGGIHFI